MGPDSISSSCRDCPTHPASGVPEVHFYEPDTSLFSRSKHFSEMILSQESLCTNMIIYHQ